jgi:putative SOS response-associated peptidase YedK
MFSQFQNRQPVILEPNEHEEWLAPSERPAVHLLSILREEKMRIVPVEAPKQELAEPMPVTGSLFGDET